MKYLAIIPARGGSKGIPKKNLCLLNGMPLIYHTINAAISSKFIEKTILSTDSQEIADVGSKYGAEVPFLRPEDYAKDSSPTIDTVLHTIKWLEENLSYEADAVILLQPTSPLRTVFHIDEAINIFNKKQPDTLVSIVEVPHNYSPDKLLRFDKNIMRSFENENSHTIKPRQDMPKLYARNGPAILIFNIDFIKKEKSFYSGNTLPYLMKKEVSIDIDDKSDLLLAELILKNRIENEKNI